jgi:hypothetical protein
MITVHPNALMAAIRWSQYPWLITSCGFMFVLSNQTHSFTHKNLNIMKKLFLSLSLAAVTLLAVANPPKNKDKEKMLYTYAANQTLQQRYGSVEDLKWSKAKDNLIRADFIIDGETFSSFFNQQGDFVATTTERTLTQLPAMVRKIVKTKFDGKEITNMVQYHSDTEIAYYVEVIDRGKTKVFKITSAGGISRFS